MMFQLESGFATPADESIGLLRRGDLIQSKPEQSGQDTM